MLLLEFSCWEEKQQAVLNRIRAGIGLPAQDKVHLREGYINVSAELRGARQRVQELEQERKDLRKECDENSRRADRWERVHDELKSKLTETEEQVKKLVQEKHQARATALQEQSRNLVKNKEVRNLNRELEALARSYQDLHKRHQQAIGRKKTSQEKWGYELRSKADKEKEPRLVKCSQCYTKKWPCDAGHPCKACIARGIPGGCKRVKCQFWTKGTCLKRQCGLAHEDDGFDSAIEHRKLKQKATPMPVELAMAISAPTVENHGQPSHPNDATSKKHGRDDSNGVQDMGSNKRSKLNTTAQQLHQGNGYEQDQQDLDPMDQSADRDDSADLIFQTCTITPGLMHHSLEEHRFRDYINGYRCLYHSSGCFGVHCSGGCCAVHRQHSDTDIDGWLVKFRGGPLRLYQGRRRIETARSRDMALWRLRSVPSRRWHRLHECAHIDGLLEALCSEGNLTQTDSQDAICPVIDC